MTIKREHLIKAINKGIASSHLPEFAREKLQAFARETTAVGENYSQGCPIRACDLEGVSGAVAFTLAYDDCLFRLTKEFPAGLGRVAEVIG